MACVRARGNRCGLPADADGLVERYVNNVGEYAIKRGFMQTVPETTTVVVLCKIVFTPTASKSERVRTE